MLHMATRSLLVACLISTASMCALCNPAGTSAILQPEAKSGLKVLGLRGGFGVMGMNSNAKPDPNAQSPQPASGTTTPRGGTAFTKIVYTKVPGETPKTVEVAGSWSKFKQRNAMTRNAAGDFEIIMELPRGQHEIKFVLDNGRWVCHPDLEARRDTQGNQNNVIHVDNVARPTGKAGAPTQREEGEVFVPHKSSIDIARDVVMRLEQEKKTAQEKLAKAHQQLVQTLVEELDAGKNSLDKSKKLVVGFNETGTSGLNLVRQAGEAKMNEIRQHMAKIRQILDQKEQIALDTVEGEMKKRLGVLTTEVAMYSSIIPELDGLLERTAKAVILAKSDSATFISTANELVATISDKTQNAAALRPPTDDADFENLSLNLLPPGSS